MIKLIKDGQYLELENGEAITIEYISTIFNDEAEFNGSYSYPVRAPFSEKNNDLLKNACLVENRSARGESMVTIEIFGQPWKQAKLSFDVTPEGYSFYCKIDNAEFAKIIKEKLLTDIFINTNAGSFVDHVYDLLGSSRLEVLNTLNDRAQNPGKGSCVFFPFKNDLMLGGTSPDSGSLDYDSSVDLFNYHTPDRGFAPMAYDGANARTHFYVPFYYLHWVIKKLCLYLGFEPTGDFFLDPRTANLVIFNTGFIGMNDIFATDGCKLAPARHLPSIKIADFIKKLRSTFKLGIYFDGKERKAIFTYSPRIAASPEAVDITGYTEPGYTIKQYVATGYELVQPIDEKDDLFSAFSYVNSYFIGDNTEPQKLESFIGTTFMSSTQEPRRETNNTWRIPRVRMLGNGFTAQAASSEAYNEQGYYKNAFDLRLLAYHGMQYDSAYQQYPYASSDNLNSFGQETENQISLWLGTRRGMINEFLKEWILFYLRTEQVELTAFLPPELLFKLSPLRKLTWTTPTQALMPAMLSQISFETVDLYDDRIGAKLLVYPIYNQAASDVKQFVEFQPGEIENPGEIYVKLRMDVYKEEKIRVINQIIILSRYVNGYLDFFSDPECTKPRNVSNLPINMFYKYRGANSRNYVDKPFTVYASGTSHQVMEDLGIDQTVYYKSSKDYWNKYYELHPGPDYHVIS
ncbi:hypothetical protein KHS38_11700 [Mucilaginibacter sp. Bleaf8]|uniref:hypothetical protein n=1 Tax=Mucilaginibacter sp. Bleaf8 TaxID=2834430 RepID=UPI001BD14991|nr:hypothetical protein [Mucilaginibacter sp. Bleaf8]MBS7565069.1 hypothetical protein [Mucilaginibacter sp. Bleaf8]